MQIKADASVSVSKGDDGEIAEVNIEGGDEAGLLIGRHGETLTAIQSFISLALKQETGEWVRVVVNVGDYRDKQEERLVNLALQAADRAKQTGESQHLYNLSAGERRVIHMELSKDKDIETESAGEGEERYLIIKAK